MWPVRHDALTLNVVCNVPRVPVATTATIALMHVRPSSAFATLELANTSAGGQGNRPGSGLYLDLGLTSEHGCSGRCSALPHCLRQSALNSFGCLTRAIRIPGGSWAPVDMHAGPPGIKHRQHPAASTTIFARTSAEHCAQTSSKIHLDHFHAYNGTMLGLTGLDLALLPHAMILSAVAGFMALAAPGSPRRRTFATSSLSSPELASDDLAPVRHLTFKFVIDLCGRISLLRPSVVKQSPETGPAARAPPPGPSEPLALLSDARSRNTHSLFASWRRRSGSQLPLGFHRPTNCPSRVSSYFVPTPACLLSTWTPTSYYIPRARFPGPPFCRDARAVQRALLKARAHLVQCAVVNSVASCIEYRG